MDRWIGNPDVQSKIPLDLAAALCGLMDVQSRGGEITFEKKGMQQEQVAKPHDNIRTLIAANLPLSVAVSNETGFGRRQSVITFPFGGGETLDTNIKSSMGGDDHVRGSILCAAIFLGMRLSREYKTKYVDPPPIFLQLQEKYLELYQEEKVTRPEDLLFEYVRLYIQPEHPTTDENGMSYESVVTGESVYQDFVAYIKERGFTDRDMYKKGEFYRKLHAVVKTLFAQANSREGDTRKMVCQPYSRMSYCRLCFRGYNWTKDGNLLSTKKQACDYFEKIGTKCRVLQNQSCIIVQKEHVILNANTLNARAAQSN